MKKWAALLVLPFLLAGCGSQPVLETISDLYLAQEVAAKEVTYALPEDVAAPVGGQTEGVLYVGDGYTMSVQTLPGGDLQRTFRLVSGFDSRHLRPVIRKNGELDRYDYAWSCAGEGGEWVCRGVLLDDGCYHYVLTVQMEADRAGELNENVSRLCASFTAG